MNKTNIKTNRFFTGLSCFVDAIKNWRVSAIVMLFTIIAIHIYQQAQASIENPTLSSVLAIALGTGFIIALGFVLGIYTALKMDKTLSEPINDLYNQPSKGKVFNQSFYAAFKDMYFLGKSLLLFWLGTTFIVLNDQLYNPNIFPSYDLFVVVTSIIHFILLFYVFPVAGFMINKRVYGTQVYKSYKDFSKFALTNIISIIISYVLFIVIIFVVILVLVQVIFTLESKDSSGLYLYLSFYLSLSIILVLIINVYFVFLQVLIQRKYNQRISSYRHE